MSGQSITTIVRDYVRASGTLALHNNYQDYPDMMLSITDARCPMPYSQLTN